jgi:hypothetical protein
MYGSIRRYRIRSGNVDEIVEKVKAGLLPVLEKTPGFVAYYILNAESNRATSFTIGENREALEQMNRIALDWVKSNLADRLSEPEVLTGPVPVALIHQHA